MPEEESPWEVDCSDEEIEKAFEDSHLGCIPTSADAMVSALNDVIRCKGGEEMLSWRCQYGRRPPTPQMSSNSPSEDEQVVESMVDTSGFDFSDESGSVKLHPRRSLNSATPKGSAKKKTTSFENILASVYRRQRNIESPKEKNRHKQ